MHFLIVLLSFSLCDYQSLTFTLQLLSHLGILSLQHFHIPLQLFCFPQCFFVLKNIVSLEIEVRFAELALVSSGY